MSILGQWGRLLLHTWADLVGLDPIGSPSLTVPGVLDSNPGALAWSVVVTIPLVAALAGMVGDIGLVVINNIRGVGVVVAGLLSGVQTILTHAVQGLLLWAMVLVSPVRTPPLTVVVQVVLVSLAPLWFSWVAIAPFIGPLLERVLHVWQFLVMWSLVSDLTGLPWWSLALVTVAWLARQVLVAVVRVPLAVVREAVWWRLTGTRRLLSAQQVFAELSAPAAAEELALAHGPRAKPGKGTQP
ncbi:hypothetical protein [Aestuariimicrobium kwangyangense]|uniref:hypothetical protein n=1 Tax=Aestuariimicrobium kwangyangense TaxID=396389 RepID=UPI0003B514B8|nr:hypothetical protein [Aestuariimicrobium kwangyangense]